VRAVPPELSVRLGSLDLRTPVVCGSGEHVMTAETIDAAVDAGAAAVVAKSANESAAARRQLASAEYAWLDERRRPTDPGAGASLLNRSGLVDEPFGSWIETLARCDARARRRDAYVAASLIPADEQVLPELAAQVEQAGLRWLELNLSAPHAGEAVPGAIRRAEAAVRVGALTAGVRARVALHLSVKLTCETADAVALARAARDAGADSVVLTGRFLGFLPDLETRRPVLGTFGGYGGPWALPIALRWIAKTRLALGPELPLAGTSGARSGDDVARFLLAGASAVQLASAVLAEGPAALTRVTTELRAYLERTGLEAQALVGQAADAVLTYEQAADTMRSRA
jgi:dihydroorotate dehydrogenase (NAD+) catalytic subunit